jgi:NADH-quinone oxidoreductase subunit M
VLAAAYLLWMFQRVMQGPITNEKILSFKDMNKREIAYLLPIVIMMFWMGIYPKPFLKRMDSYTNDLLKRVIKKERIFIQTEKETKLLNEIDKMAKIKENKEKEEKAR